MDAWRHLCSVLDLDSRLQHCHPELVRCSLCWHHPPLTFLSFGFILYDINKNQIAGAWVCSQTSLTACISPHTGQSLLQRRRWRHDQVCSQPPYLFDSLCAAGSSTMRTCSARPPQAPLNTSATPCPYIPFISPARSLAGTTGVDWVMHPSTAFVLLRFGSCYDNGNNADFGQYAFPSVRVVCTTTAALLPSCVAGSAQAC